MSHSKRSRLAFWLAVGGLAAFFGVFLRSRLRKVAVREDSRIAGAGSLAAYNRDFYDRLWNQAHLIAPQHFNTWPLVRELARAGRSRLEIGPGLRPRLPLPGTHFVDLSPAAVAKLRGAGGQAQVGTATALPGADASYDLVCALDIVEHIADADAALREMARVIRPGGRLLFSAPLHPDRWTSFDRTVGHARRFDPAELEARLAHHGFAIEASAAYGMQPRASWLLDFGMWCLEMHRAQAMWFYSHIFMPFALRKQPALQLEPGFSAAAADEVLLLCHWSSRPPGD